MARIFMPRTGRNHCNGQNTPQAIKAAIKAAPRFFAALRGRIARILFSAGTEGGSVSRGTFGSSKPVEVYLPDCNPDCCGSPMGAHVRCLGKGRKYGKLVVMQRRDRQAF